MGIINRIGDIIDSNLSSVLDRAEDPEVAIGYAIRKMEDALTEARSGAVRLMAERKGFEASWREAEFEMMEWERRAELALSHGREDLARAALTAKARIAQAAKPAHDEMDAIDQAIAKLNADAQALQAKLTEAHARRRSIVARHRGAVDRLRVRETLYDGRLDEAMSRYDQLHHRVDQVEARSEMMTPRRPFTLAEEIDALAADARVSEELAALKAKVAAR